MSFFSISKSQLSDNTMDYSHSHKYYEIYLQISGTRTYFYRNNYYNVGENTLIVTRPDSLHLFEGGPYHRWLIGIDAALLSSAQIDFLNLLDEESIVSLDKKYIPEITNSFETLLKTDSVISKNKHILIALELGHLFHLLHLAHTNTVPPIANLKQEKVGNLTAPIIVKVVRYIQENFHKKFSLQELSMEYQLSQPWLCKCFLNAMGMTIFEYKTMLQVQNAKKLLNATSLSLNAIADKCGFSSSRYFCMVFKKHTDTSPLQWRKHFRPTDNTILNKKRK